MTEPSNNPWLSYKTARDRLRKHPLRAAEVPVEHAIALLLPTHRDGGPGYVQFAAPAVRQPETPTTQGPPERWWILDAATGQLRLFCWTQAYPFTTTRFDAVTLPMMTVTLDELRRTLQELEQLLETLTPLFFAQESAAPDLRRQTGQLLEQAIAEPLRPQYRALAPDFFRWLEE